MVVASPGPSIVGLLVPSPAKRDVLGTRRTDWARLACAARQAAPTKTAIRSHTRAPMPDPPCNRFIIRSAIATGGAARDSYRCLCALPGDSPESGGLSKLTFAHGHQSRM